jgi:hypothetical protein
VPLGGVGAHALEPPEHALELGVVEQVGPPAGRADQVMMVLAAGHDELVARLPLADIQPTHEAELAEQAERPVDRGGADPARALAGEVRELLGAQASTLAVEDLDHGVAGPPAAVARRLQRPARVLAPGHVGSALRAAPRTR